VYRIIIIVLAFLCLLLKLHTNTVAQSPDHNINHLKVRLGFFAGPTNYIGDYNPWLFGSDVSLGGDQTIETEGLTGDLDFGFWTKIMLKKYLHLRGNASFGTLAFNIDEIDHRMNTSYKSFGIALELSAFNDSRIRPYITGGISTINYTVPLANQSEQFSDFNVSEQGDDKSAMAIPVGIGIDYHISDLTTIFFESNLTLTDADDLDNISLPSEISDAPFSNDAFVSYRFGIGFSIIELFKLKFGNKKKPKPKPVPIFKPTFDKELMETTIKPKNLLTEEEIENDKRRFFPSLYDTTPPESDQIEDSVETRPRQEDEKTEAEANEDADEKKPDTGIQPDLTPAEGFNIDKELQKLNVLRLQALQSTRNDTSVSLQDAFRLVPRRNTAVFPLFDSADGKIITATPPKGYYIQVYASVGPESTNKALENLRNILSDTTLVDESKSIFVTERDSYYEVRVGPLNTYNETVDLLDIIQGTFFDAYIILYTAE